MKVRNIILLLIIALLIASFTFVVFAGIPIGIYDFNPVGSIQQGLDLTGGITLVYEAADPTVDDLDTKIQGAMDIFRSRLDDQGFTEAVITTQGTDKIRIEIPINDSSKNTDPADVIKFISTPAVLEFRNPSGDVVLKGEHIKSAKPMVNDKGNYVVSFELDSQGTSDFAKATTELINQKISIYLDDQLISSPTVNSAITGGSGIIEGGKDFTLETVTNLAMQIESGAIPLDLNVIEQRTVSSTLGDDALSNSIKAAIIGLAILVVFMAVVYRVPGLMADIALIGYISLVVFCISWFGVQLTLPGIAGIILGIGMAVDANVVIFERIKEEHRAGRTLRLAVKNGFHKASTAIIDSNITTIIAAAVLALFGTGSIKGFAYTLLISIVISLFTTLVVSQVLLKLICGIAPNGTKMYFAQLKPKNEDEKAKKPLKIVENFKKLIIIPAVILVVSIVICCFTGGLNLGVDFTGGTVVTVDVGETFNSEDVLKAVEGVDGVGSGVSVTSSDNNQALIKIQSSGDETTEEQVVSDIVDALHNAGYENAARYNTDSVGAVSSAELIKNALLSVLIACVLMLIYITIRFEFWMAIGSVVALVHDVLIMIAVMGIFRVTIDSTFIAACLTIVGYSINNTVIIFDKVRDNLYISGGDINRETIVSDSVKSTLGRTVNTTVTTLIMIASLYILGVTSIKVFTLPIIVGLFAGTFSSLVIAPSIWALCSKKSKKSKHPVRKVKVIR